MSDSWPAIVCLSGPTACGKTALSIEVAKSVGAEIISVDSALIYKGMDIGTAKPDKDEMSGIAHHLIDIKNPDEPYSAADFRNDALRLIREIAARGSLPLLVGGTMLYLKALLEGISDLPQSDPAVRERLTKEAADLGIPSLHARLKDVDPVSWERIKPNDAQRTLRALEVWETSGKSLTELTNDSKAVPYEGRVLHYALMPSDRETLRTKIGIRFDRMLEAGFADEASAVADRFQNRDLPSLRSVGYRQYIEYLDGKLSYDEMIFRAKVATCQLAKRQITWLRGWKLPVEFLEPGDERNKDIIISGIKSFLAETR